MTERDCPPTIGMAAVEFPEYCRAGDGTMSRNDDMIKIKATNVWPEILVEAVHSFGEIE